MVFPTHELTDGQRELRDHAFRVAHAFGITIIEVPIGATARTLVAYIPTRSIITSPIINESTYAAALHEMGHLEHPNGAIVAEILLAQKLHQTLRANRLSLYREECAWEWAQNIACRWSAMMEAVKDYGLASYRKEVA